ncbi:GspH/FimT family pseudopilin [Vogesella sp. GCM10023246]|uniref:Type II secretion system protein H n=1 Tax=Vogesella oryzagri TaxID=3160864 RepID=A0ABV1M0I9_9NEIS
MLRQQAFTLIEMLVTLALLAVVTAFVVADLGRTMRLRHYSSVLNEMVGNFALARSEARMRRLPVHACAVNLKSNLDVQGCQPQTTTPAPYRWEEGLMIFYDKVGGRSGVYDSKEQLAITAIEPGLHLMLTTSQRLLTFNPDGMMKSSQVVFEFAVPQDGWCQRLIIFRTGISRQGDCG